MIPWMRVSSGKHVNLAEFSVGDVDLEDVITALSNIKRCNGHGDRREPLSVLQHSMLVCDLAHEFTGSHKLALAGLLHDAHEAYIGDTTSPVKTLTGFIEPCLIVNAVRQRLGTDAEDCRMIKQYDLAALEIEWKSQWPYSKEAEQYWPPVVLHIGEREALRKFDQYRQLDDMAFRSRFYFHGGNT